MLFLLDSLPPFSFCHVYPKKSYQQCRVDLWHNIFFYILNSILNFIQVFETKKKKKICELECVGHNLAYVAHFVLLRDVWIRTQRAVATYQLCTHLPFFPAPNPSYVQTFVCCRLVNFCFNAGVYQLPAELEHIAIPNEAELLGRRG